MESSEIRAGAAGGERAAHSDAETDPRILILSPADNVGVVIRDLSAGERLVLRGGAAVTEKPIALGHKIAIAPIAVGERIIKYGAPIGSSLRAISIGEHVHTHNIKSDYLPPFGREGSGRGSGGFATEQEVLATDEHR